MPAPQKITLDRNGTLLTSDDGSVILRGGPAEGQVDLQVNPAILSGTLAAIYTAGLAAPAVDNLFPMPSGNLRFPGSLTRGGGGLGAQVQYFEDGTAIDLAAPPSWALISKAANLSGVGGSGEGFFNLYEFNDPLWNNTFAELNGVTVQWFVENVYFSSDPSQDPATHAATLFGARWYASFGTGPYVGLPAVGTVGSSMLHYTALFNGQTNTGETVEELDSYGQVGYVLRPNQHGQTAQFVTHWSADLIGLAAGDGPAWTVEIAGTFGHYNPVAALQFYQLDPNPALGWGAKLITINHAGTAFTDALDVNIDRGLLNGVEIATLSTAAVRAVSPVLDFTLSNVGVSMTPKLQRAGFYFVCTGVELLSRTPRVTAATGDLVARLGNDGGHVNVVNGTHANPATINSAGTIAPYVFANFFAPPAGAVYADAAAEIVLDTDPPAGVTAFTGQVVVQGVWVPI